MHRVLMIISKVLLITCILISNKSLAQENVNIIIAKKTDKYEFINGNHENPVLIKQTTSKTYKCNEFRTSIPYAEFYNDKVSIDDVKILVNGSKRNNITPKYDYYEVNDIFYSDARVCYFSLPLTKKEGECEVTIEKTFKDPRYFTNIYFSEPYVVEKCEIIIVVPDWVKASFKEFNFPPSAIKISTSRDEKRNATIYTYSYNNIPAQKNETKAPGPTYIYPHLLALVKSAYSNSENILYFNKVQDQYKWYKNLIDKTGNDVNSLKAKAFEIIKNEKTDIDKIKAVFNWVQANIRYVAFEDGIAGFKPESAQEVMRKKYGDCKGMANLTKVLLSNIGFDAKLCWLGTDHIAYDYSTPSLAVDNHAICAVKYNGTLYYLDATEKFIGFNEYAQRIQGRPVMIENSSTCVIEKIPERTGEQNIESENNFLVLENNNLKGTSEKKYKGESKEYFLSGYNDIKIQNQQRVLERYLANDKDNCIISDLSFNNLQDWNNDITFKYKVLFKDAVSEFGDEKYLDIDLKKEFMNLVIDSSRVNDYWFNYKYNIVSQTEIMIPDKWKPTQLPEPLNIVRDMYRFKAKYSFVGNKIIYSKELIFYNTKLPKNKFSQWNDDIKKLKDFYLEQITIKK